MSIHEVKSNNRLVVVFLSRLDVLLESGVSLLESIDLVVTSNELDKFFDREKVGKDLVGLKEGGKISDSLRKLNVLEEFELTAIEASYYMGNLNNTIRLIIASRLRLANLS